jgi:CCR4-NOT complex subunit CAF16
MSVRSSDSPEDYSVLVRNFNFTYPNSQEKCLNEIEVKLPKGRRCLLVGGNGAGKTTMLRVLGGKHMHDDDSVFIMGKNSFKDLSLNTERQFMDPNWGMRSVASVGTGQAYVADIPVSSMMRQLQDEFPERREKLYKLLKVNPEWRMHKVSDGQRRRVQMLLGLLRPFNVLLLDEVTAVLDLVCRQDLLQFLKEECEERGCTIVYATHIFDGLDEWASDLIYLRTHPNGTIGYNGPIKEVPLFQQHLAAGHPSPLMKMIEVWLREEEAAARKAGADILETEGGSGALTEKPPPVAASSTPKTSTAGSLFLAKSSGKHYNYG